MLKVCIVDCSPNGNDREECGVQVYPTGGRRGGGGGRWVFLTGVM